MWFDVLHVAQLHLIWLSGKNVARLRSTINQAYLFTQIYKKKCEIKPVTIRFLFLWCQILSLNLESQNLTVSGTTPHTVVYENNLFFSLKGISFILFPFHAPPRSATEKFKTCQVSRHRQMLCKHLGLTLKYLNRSQRWIITCAFVLWMHVQHSKKRQAFWVSAPSPCLCFWPYTKHSEEAGLHPFCSNVKLLLQTLVIIKLKPRDLQFGWRSEGFCFHHNKLFLKQLLVTRYFLTLECFSTLQELLLRPERCWEGFRVVVE